MKHPLCRPPKGAIDVRKLVNFKPARWAKDDGKPGLAFFGLAGKITNTISGEVTAEDDDATVWVANCDCKVHADCPASKALDKACAIYDGASLVRRPKTK